MHLGIDRTIEAPLSGCSGKKPLRRPRRAGQRMSLESPAHPTLKARDLRNGRLGFLAARVGALSGDMIRGCGFPSAG